MNFTAKNLPSKIFSVCRKKSFCALIFLLMFFIIVAAPVFAASVLTVGQDDGYSGRIMNKIISKWTPPAQIKGNYRLDLRIMLDGDGELLDCKVQKPSGFEPLDISACGAVRAAAPYETPPYGQPADIHFAFWSGNPGKLRKETATLEAYTPDGSIGSSRAATERAKAQAEKAARESGRTVPTGLAAASTGNAALERAKAKADEAAKATGKKLPEEVGHTPPEPQTPVPQATAQERRRAVEQERAENATSGGKDAKRAVNPEKYLSTVTWKLRNAMYVPMQAKPGTYHVLARITCDKTGKIISSSILDGSGDEMVDKYVLQGIRRAGKITPPPEVLGDTLDLNFTLVRK